MLGVVSMVNQKQFLTQYFAYFNLMSLVSNILILFIYELYSDDSFGKMMSGLLIAVKMV